MVTEIKTNPDIEALIQDARDLAEAIVLGIFPFENVEEGIGLIMGDISGLKADLGIVWPWDEPYAAVAMYNDCKVNL